MANIIDLNSRRPNKSCSVTLQSIADESIEFLISEWEKFSRKNRLNEYFVQYFPNFVDVDSRVNFMSDLTELAALESTLGRGGSVFAPYALHPQQVGWVSRFKMAAEEISTPDMSSECHARAFALLLYLRVKAKATELGLIQ